MEPTAVPTVAHTAGTVGRQVNLIPQNAATEAEIIELELSEVEALFEITSFPTMEPTDVPTVAHTASPIGGQVNLIPESATTEAEIIERELSEVAALFQLTSIPTMEPDRKRTRLNPRHALNS